MVDCRLWDGGAFIAAESVPLSDRGFRYGMSVFESVLVRAGRPVFLREHLDRLQKALLVCEFKVALPPLDECAAAMQTDGLARIYVTAGNGSATGSADDCRIFIFSEPRPPLVQSGYDLVLADEPHLPLFNGLKTANYWPHLTALRSALSQKKNEALLFDHAGYLLSACMANVFLVHGETISTPALGRGARDGVVRAWVLQKHKVRETALTRTEVETADGIFLTSSWLGIMPAASLNGQTLCLTNVATALRTQYEAALPIA